MTDLEAANFLAALARNPKNERFKARLEIAAAHLIDGREDLTEAHEKIKTLESEITFMRDFISSVPILVNSNAQAVAAVGTLTATNAQLTTDNTRLAADLAAAQANQLTPEVKAAQDAVIAAAEVISPSAA